MARGQKLAFGHIVKADGHIIEANLRATIDTGDSIVAASSIEGSRNAARLSAVGGDEFELELAQFGGDA